jgi:hypothetical protein
VDDYIARAQKSGKSLGYRAVEEIEIPSSKDDEGTRLLAKHGQGILIRLDERGEAWTSQDLSKRLARWRDAGEDACQLRHRRRRRHLARGRRRRPPHHQLRRPDLAPPPRPRDDRRAGLPRPFDRGRITLPPRVMRRLQALILLLLASGTPRAWPSPAQAGLAPTFE